MASKDSSLQVQTHEENAVTYKLEIEVEAKRVGKAFDQAYRDLGKRAQIKGFRKGKAPRSVLEKVYAKDLAHELEHTLISETLPEAIEQSELVPVSQPRVDAAHPVQGEAFTYTAIIEVKPKIEIGDLAGLKGTRLPIEVSDEELEERLKQLSLQAAPFIEEPEGTQVETGHSVQINFAGTIDGEAFEGGSHEGAVLEIGSGRMIPGFEEAIVGHQAGESFEIEVTFPEDYGHEEVAGKDAKFQIDLLEIKRQEIPEIDDEFAKDQGEFETLDELKEDMRKNLLRAKENESTTALRKTLFDSLLELVEFEVPAGLVDSRLSQRLQQTMQQFQGQLPEEVLQSQILHFQKEWRPMVEREIREALLVEAIGQDQKFEISDEAVEAKVQEMAEQHGMEADQIRGMYGGAQLTEGLRAQLLDEAVIAFLEEKAEITEGEVQDEDSGEAGE